jgi:hypothetical protein
MQGGLDPYMATLPFRVDAATREQIPDAQKPVLFMFKDVQQALAQIETMKKKTEGGQLIRIAIEAEGSREIAELVELGKVYTGASWFENHRMRAEADYYAEVVGI